MSNHSNRQERENLQEYDRWLVEEIVPYVIRDRPGEADEMQAYSPSNELASQLYQENSPPMIYTTTESPPAGVWVEGNDYATEAGYSKDGRFVPREQYVPFDSDLARASPFTGYPVQTSMAGYQAQTPSVAGYQAQTPSVAGYQAQTPSVAGYQAQTPPTYDSDPSGHVEHGHGIAYAQSRPASRELEDGWHQYQPGVWEWLGQGAPPPGSQGTQLQPARNVQTPADLQNTNREAYARVSAPSSQRYSSPSVQLVTTPSQFLDAIDGSPRSWENMTDVSDNQSEDQNHSVAGDSQRVSGSHRGNQSRVRRVRRRRRQ
ncbi:uncharacterized protein EAE97_005961 [Botrytis byssoidea]|uniref:Uncharacterized protein n=1 Tax=Botrytis byssoidea TaxID=139641 RepID=A0A9P5ISN1_9HELO|nr:uncharacterized protein EAE97_005961 [Botrytis byssoidea]KAF7943891.1 hypothetical protein EAE97_005961 [Botrytis byssoidea]